MLRQAEIFARNQLRHRVLGSDRLHPLYAIYELTWACNLDCTYCDDGAGHSYPHVARQVQPLALADARRMLERVRREVPAIYITGGEPTVHPRFLELMAAIDQLGFAPVIVNTNGLRLAPLLRRDPELLRKIDILVFSLDALDPGVLDRLSGRAGRGAQILAAFELARERAARAGTTLAVNCVVTRETVEDARAVARRCGELGLPFLPVPANRGKGLLAPLTGDAGFRSLADELRGPGAPGTIGPPEVTSILMGLGRFECHPAARIHITPDGRVPWPCQSDARFALPILEFPSLGALLEASEARFSIERQGQACGSPCYLAQNVSTDLYVNRPLSTAARAARDMWWGPR
jgi:MoaA/NifB/PqqE/SkfB family radical SAM enzyme